MIDGPFNNPTLQKNETISSQIPKHAFAVCKGNGALAFSRGNCYTMVINNDDMRPVLIEGSVSLGRYHVFFDRRNVLYISSQEVASLNPWSAQFKQRLAAAQALKKSILFGDEPTPSVYRIPQCQPILYALGAGSIPFTASFVNSWAYYTGPNASAELQSAGLYPAGMKTPAQMTADGFTQRNIGTWEFWTKPGANAQRLRIRNSVIDGVTQSLGPISCDAGGNFSFVEASNVAEFSHSRNGAFLYPPTEMIIGVTTTTTSFNGVASMEYIPCFYRISDEFGNEVTRTQIVILSEIP
jgi:hypothetical protein